MPWPPSRSHPASISPLPPMSRPWSIRSRWPSMKRAAPTSSRWWVIPSAARTRSVRFASHRRGPRWGLREERRLQKNKLKWPSAIVCYKGGVFVGASPDLYYFKDTNGDGVCDEEKTVFTGFGEGNMRLNMQALFNSLRWGPDNRIWGQTAGNGGTVTKPGDPNFAPVAVRGADFSFDPETLDFRQENGTAQYGMTFDSLGRRFVCANSRHLIWVAYERHQVKSNPWFSLPAAARRHSRGWSGSDGVSHQSGRALAHRADALARGRGREGHRGGRRPRLGFPRRLHRRASLLGRRLSPGVPRQFLHR